MFHFTFDTYQLGVQLRPPSPGTAEGAPIEGRCIVDGMMNLQQFSWIYTFPLRTIVIYNFRLLENGEDGIGGKEPRFEIYRQEEMWFVK
jgi:hypothetical protein